MKSLLQRLKQWCISLLASAIMEDPRFRVIHARITALELILQARTISGIELGRYKDQGAEAIIIFASDAGNGFIKIIPLRFKNSHDLRDYVMGLRKQYGVGSSDVIDAPQDIKHFMREWGL